MLLHSSPLRSSTTDITYEANRRVSFAPEATLHTWNVVELMEDSTASTASTNPTRRASTLALAHHNPPSSPEEENDALEQFSPADRGSLDQRQYRQSPGAELDNIDNDEAFSSSPFSGDSGLDGDDTGVASLVPESHDNLSDSDLDNDSTAMSLDATQQSIRSTHSNDSTTDSARLDRSLRLAARIAGTNGIEYDENGDLSVENANLEIAGAFKPWIKKGADRSDFDAAELTSRFDQENVDPRQKPFSESQESSNGKDSDEIDETGMDLTDAVGGILSKYQRRDPSEYSTDKARRISSATSYQGDQTMELTNVVGGIHKDFSPARDYSGESDVAEDEEMTMEFTSVFGGVLNKILPKKDNPDPNTDQPGDFEEQDEELYPDLSAVDMEMIGAVGGILPPIEEQTEPVEDETMGMEMTNAIGKILPSLRPTAGVIQDDNSDHEPASSPFQENIISSPPKPTTPLRIASRPSPEESPTLSIIRLKPNQRRSSSRLSTTPTKSASQRATPAQKTLTPSKQKSPRPIRSTTPATPTVTPPTRTTRSSPRKQNKSQPQKSELTSGSIFQINHENGHSTPKIVLQARRRSPSGLGADKEGLGSPRVAEILDRRKSIGEDAQSFTPASQKSRESQHIESHNLQDGIKEELHVPGRQDAAVTESTEARRNVSFNIREMISQLTPKKDKLKGRKSLHVGAAKGLLGKRPVELDIDDDEDSTPKRLRVRELSPVKNVKLPAPPSKAETVGKISHLSLRNTTESPSMSSRTPLEESIRSSGLNIEETINRTSQEVAVESEIVQDPKPSTPEVKRLQLSEFLELTNIHFMELTTTKRRQTLAVDTEKKQFGDAESEERKETSLEDCVAAGLCTIPMLELYQHVSSHTCLTNSILLY